jgi:subtilisin family serine protease
MPPASRFRCRLALSAFVLAFAVVASNAATAGAAGSHGGRHDDVRILVKLRPHASPGSLARVLAEIGARRDRTIADLGVQVLRVPRSEARAALARLARVRELDYSEPDRVVLQITQADAVQRLPSDPLWPQQWAPVVIDAPTAWAVTRGSPNVVVAVLDTGVDATQPDLQGALVPGYDFIHNNANPDDDFGHGTGVAGIIGARADNGIGVTGLCPSCSIMPVKVVASDGSATGANVALGITWAVDHGARVINMSLGGTFDSTVASAVNYATSKGVIVVAAAGNNGNSQPFYPAADAGVLSVAATQQNDQLYSWSNFGTWVSVAAPGCGVTTFRGGVYGEFCGTSASTPLVSGLAGLAFSYSPTASAATIEQAIVSRAYPIGGVAHGRVDVAGTLAALGAVFKPVSVPSSGPGVLAPSGGAAPGPVAAQPGKSKGQHVRSSATQRMYRVALKRMRLSPRARLVQRQWRLRWLRVEQRARRR